MTNFDPRPCVLQHPPVRLEPLQPTHAAALQLVGADKAIWRYMPDPPLTTVADAERWIVAALESAETGEQVPFAIVDMTTERVVGSTRYLDIRPAHRGLEIGYTWLHPSAQRTPINSTCKFLLLTHAFETLDAMRVQFKTDARNVRSQEAIERVGGRREGVLRHHMIMPDGYRRDSILFSITADEWPAVKQRLISLVGFTAEGPAQGVASS